MVVAVTTTVPFVELEMVSSLKTISFPETVRSPVKDVVVADKVKFHLLNLLQFHRSQGLGH